MEGPFVRLEHTLRTLRPKIVVAGGAAIGLVAGGVAYGVASTGTTSVQMPITKVAAVSLVDTPVSAPAEPLARPQCAKGAKLQKGVCIVHVERVVNVERVVHLPAAAPALAQAQRVVSVRGSSSSSHDATQVGEHSTEASDSEVENEPEEVDHESEDVDHESGEVDHESEDVNHE